MATKQIDYSSVQAACGPFVEATKNLLEVYLANRDSQSIGPVMVGAQETATISIDGGPITKEVIDDLLSHLVFYKKYFPKQADLVGRDPNTIQIIVDNALSELRAMMASADQKLLQQSDHE